MQPKRFMISFNKFPFDFPHNKWFKLTSFLFVVTHNKRINKLITLHPRQIAFIQNDTWNFKRRGNIKLKHSHKNTNRKKLFRMN